MSSVGAVVVTYHPDRRQLDRLLGVLHEQVAITVVVDNTPGQVEIPVPEHVRLIRNGANRGIAAALNQGVVALRALGARFCLFMDQDSLPAPGMVDALATTFLDLRERGVKVGAVGPFQMDGRSGRLTPLVRFRLPMNRRGWPGSGPEAVETDFLITSGTLTAPDVMSETGPFEEGFVIDNVDLEWSFRARSQGFRLFGAPRARLEHRIGETRRVWGILYIRWHSPVRLYYMMRNRVRLYRRSYAPKAWVIHDMGRLTGKLVGFSLFVPPRVENFRAMMRGLRDGWHEVSGPENLPRKPTGRDGIRTD